MKKLLFISVMLFTLTSYSQVLNKEKNGYTEVVDVKLTKIGIYQKINEWIAVNYKSAQDVIQLNTEDKIIIKGNYVLILSNNSFRVHNSLTFSIRDNKYKVDLMLNNITTSDFKLSDVQSQQIMNTYSPKKLDKNTHNKDFTKNNVARFKSFGWSDKKIKRKFLDKPIDEKFYDDYLKDKLNWDKSVEATFQSIKTYISQSNSSDDW
tara:strand:- start:212 stop:832 length:621 start_codon:yes stop_codon:yes gene_type:complete